MIQVRGLKKNFDSFQALNNVNLSVPKGAVYGLVGPNGAGKSTLIRHLTGIYKQDAGEIKVDGQPIFENAKLKERMAYIPDDFYYFNQATIKEMMQFYAGIYPNFDKSRYEKLKEVFGIEDNRQLQRLSKGMQKQVAFWLSISIRPDIMILDEPVDGLDPVMRRQVWSILMGDVSERATTVLVSSHNLRELEDVCDHVGILHRGEVMIERTLSELQENIVKVQLALPENAEIPSDLTLIHKSETGKLKTLIVRGAPDEISAKISAVNPLFFELLPLTLEEVFIYELGGAEYAIKDVLL